MLLRSSLDFSEKYYPHAIQKNWKNIIKFYWGFDIAS